VSLSTHNTLTQTKNANQNQKQVLEMLASGERKIHTFLRVSLKHFQAERERVIGTADTAAALDMLLSEKLETLEKLPEVRLSAGFLRDMFLRDAFWFVSHCDHKKNGRKDNDLVSSHQVLAFLWSCLPLNETNVPTIACQRNRIKTKFKTQAEKDARKLLRTLRRADKGQMRTKCIIRAVQNRLEEHDEFGALSEDSSESSESDVSDTALQPPHSPDKTIDCLRTLPIKLSTASALSR
jgi:hypothetical protein